MWETTRSRGRLVGTWIQYVLDQFEYRVKTWRKFYNEEDVTSREPEHLQQKNKSGRKQIYLGRLCGKRNQGEDQLERGFNSYWTSWNTELKRRENSTTKKM